MNATRSLSKRVVLVVDAVLYSWLLFSFWSLLNGWRYVQADEKVMDLGFTVPTAALTDFIAWLFPDEQWSVLSSVLLASAGLSAHRMASNDAAADRLERWLCIVVFTAFALGVTRQLSVFESMDIDEDGSLWDDLICVGASALVFWSGWRAVRRKGLSQSRSDHRML